MDGGMCAYEVVKFSTDTCQGEEVRDGEMSYDENEDVRWQGEEKEEHDPQSRLAAHSLILSEYRPGLVRSDLCLFLHATRSPSALPQREEREHAQRCAHIISR